MELTIEAQREEDHCDRCASALFQSKTEDVDAGVVVSGVQAKSSGRQLS